MNAATTATTLPTGRGIATRERLLDAAAERFYSQGIRATSADRIIDDVGVTKVTFYRHFRTKNDLVVAYLERQAAAEQAWFLSLVRAADPRASLHELALGIGGASCRPGFRGCAFINAAAEYPEADDPVRTVVDAHRAWMRGYFADLAAEAGCAAPATVADQLMLLRDGAMVNGYLADPETVAEALDAAFAAVISGH